MERDELDELYYITPIVNVPSIRQSGILSHARACRLPHASVAMQEIQDRRDQRTVPRGRKLHEYANLYICVRNPMLFKRRTEIDGICVLRIDVRVIDLPGVVVTSGNAASDYVRYGAGWDGLRYVDRELTFAAYWTDDDYFLYLRKKTAKCAEVLVPDIVPARFILGAYVGSAIAATKLKTCAAGMAVEVNQHMFFR
jgi:hypothetical protein